MKSNIEKGLLIIAHGSRLKSANLEIEQLSQCLQKEMEKVKIAHSFLELSPPNIEDSIKDFVNKGIKVIYLYSHFLIGGRHVTQDIPAIIDFLKQKYPAVRFKEMDYLGKNPSFLPYLKKTLKEIIK